MHAVRGVSFALRPGEVVGIVGESGSGKSVTSMAIMGLLGSTAQITGSVKFRGRELLGLNDAQMSSVRGKQVAMVFQDPMTSLDPVYRIGNQIAETVRQHDKSVSRKAAIDPGGRPAQAGRHPERGGAGQLLPARVLRRHATARRHRHRDGQPARGDHRRRADDGAGRDRPGAGARGAEEGAGRDRGGDGPDHPRPRRGRRDGRPGPGHVRRPRGREGRPSRTSSTAPGCRTRSACSAPCRASTPATGSGSPRSRAPRRR